VLHELLTHYHQVMKGLKGQVPLNVAQSMADLKFQMGQLVYPGFMADTPPEWLVHFPRYMEAALIRLEKCPVKRVGNGPSWGICAILAALCGKASGSGHPGH